MATHRHGDIVVELPTDPVYRKADGTLTATPKVFLYLEDEQYLNIVPHEIDFAVAQHISRDDFRVALEKSGWRETARSAPPEYLRPIYPRHFVPFHTTDVRDMKL